MEKNGQFGVICEQGDLGLHFDPIDKKDIRRLQQEQDKEGTNNKENAKDR